MSSTHPCSVPVARAATWRVASLIARLDAHPHRAAELRRAVGPDGVREPDRLVLTLVGVMALARRSGCTPAQVRELVQCFVQGALAMSHDPRFVEQIVLHCGRFAEAASPLFGGHGWSGVPTLAPLAVA
jgi:hypothetical protein